jgi:arabinogalactan endo-1,4-beta-galactosidase
MPQKGCAVKGGCAMKRLLSVLLAGCMLLPCMALGEPAGPQAADIFVMPVEGLKEDFIFGADISSLPSLEKSGVTYKDEAGNTAELTSLLSQSGFNYVRVRVWNDPFDGQGRGYGGGNCNVDNAVELGRRATANGMKLLVDFHYSDFWADPKKQQAPKTWVGMDIETKAKALHDFSYDALKRMKDANIDIGMVQIGNETDTMLCGENNWIKIAKLINAGSAAVREIDPKILVAVHFSQPALRFAQILNARKVDYDVYATSYYSYWHGTTGNLTKVLSEIAVTYDKQVMVVKRRTCTPWKMETSMPIPAPLTGLPCAMPPLCRVRPMPCGSLWRRCRQWGKRPWAFSIGSLPGCRFQLQGRKPKARCGKCSAPAGHPPTPVPMIPMTRGCTTGVAPGTIRRCSILRERRCRR